MVNRVPPTQGALLGLGSQRCTGGSSLEGLPGSRPRRRDLLWPVGEVRRRYRGLSLCYEPRAAGLSEAVIAPPLERVSMSRIITSFHR